MAKNPKFEQLLNDMRELHASKNSDYCGDGAAVNPYQNFEDAAAFAGCSVDTVFRVLIGIKGARLKALTSSGKPPNHESVEDTQKDLAMYGALYASYFLKLSYDDRQLLSGPIEKERRPYCGKPDCHPAHGCNVVPLSESHRVGG
jgi:hypothetical protein